MQARELEVRNRSMPSRAHRLIALAALASFVWALVLAASSGLHENVHSDAHESHHECAVTVLQSGGCDTTPSAFTWCSRPEFRTIQPVIASELIVTALFLSIAPLEHAPPQRA